MKDSSWLPAYTTCDKWPIWGIETEDGVFQISMAEDGFTFAITVDAAKELRDTLTSLLEQVSTPRSQK